MDVITAGIVSVCPLLLQPFSPTLGKLRYILYHLFLSVLLLDSITFGSTSAVVWYVRVIVLVCVYSGFLGNPMEGVGEDERAYNYICNLDKVNLGGPGWFNDVFKVQIRICTYINMHIKKSEV